VSEPLNSKRLTYAAASYLFVLLSIFCFYLFKISVIQYILPLLLIIIPLLLQRNLHFHLNGRNFIKASLVATVFLVPFYFLFLVLGGKITIPPLTVLLFHLVIASIPEEIYFRGYLQEVMGNNVKGIVLVSIAFSIMHSPRFFLNGDISALLTFFPSLVMGWLYMKKRNLLYPVIFHFLSNVLFISFF
jgi:membrane protease YdiL (CAAX protease family)